MLLCLSSRQRRVFEEPVEISGEVALEAAGGLAAAFPLLDSALDVVDGRSVCSASGDDDLVEWSVELSVVAAGRACWRAARSPAPAHVPRRSAAGRVERLRGGRAAFRVAPGRGGVPGGSPRAG